MTVIETLLPVESLDVPLSLLLHLREQLVCVSDFIQQLNSVHSQSLQADWTHYGGHKTKILQHTLCLLILRLELKQQSLLGGQWGTVGDLHLKASAINVSTETFT